jgi:hypothetical protein
LIHLGVHHTMYVTTLKVAKNHHTIVLGLKSQGLHNLGTPPIAEVAEEVAPAVVVVAARVWCPPPPKVDNYLSSDDSDGK